MPSKDELSFIVRAVDEVNATLRGVEKEVRSVRDEADRANKTIESGAIKGKNAIVTLNQATQLAATGFKVLSRAVELPIGQFASLFQTSKSLVEVYDNQIRAEVSLAVAMKNTGELTRENLDDFKAYASELQATTEASDSVILKNQAILGSFTGFGPALKDATQAALDLSAGFGLPVETSFRKFIKAAQSGSLELAEGVSIQLKATDAAGRLAEAVEEVQKKFSGFAEATALLGSGPLKQLANAFGDVQEAIGRTVAESPEFQGFVAAARDTLAQLAVELGETGTLGRNANLFGQLFGASFTIAQVAAENLVRSIFGIASAVTQLIELIPGIDTPLEAATNRLQELQEELEDVSGIVVAPTSGQFDEGEIQRRIEAEREVLAARQATLAAGDQAVANSQRTRQEIEKEVELLAEVISAQEEILRIKETDADATRRAAEAQESAKEAVSELQELYSRTRASFLEKLATETDEARQRMEDLGTTTDQVMALVGESAEKAGDRTESGLGSASGALDDLVQEFSQAGGSLELPDLDFHFDPLTPEAQRQFDAFDTAARKVSRSVQGIELALLSAERGADGLGKATQILDELERAGALSAKELGTLEDRIDEIASAADAASASVADIGKATSQIDGAKVEVGFADQIEADGALVDAADRLVDSSQATEAAATTLADSGLAQIVAADASREAADANRSAADGVDRAAADLSSVGSGIEGAAEVLAGAGTSLASAAGSHSQAAASLRSAAQAITTAASRLKSGGGGGGGGGGGNALGGVVSRPTEALVGEAGPEAILPLNVRGQKAAAAIFGLDQGGRGGGGLSLTITGNTFFGPQDLADEVERALVERLQDRIVVNLE